MLGEYLINELALQDWRNEVQRGGGHAETRQEQGVLGVRPHEPGYSIKGLAAVHTCGTYAVSFWKEPLALFAMGLLRLEVDAEFFTFGELLDAACGLAELVSNCVRVADDGQAVAIVERDFQPTAPNHGFVAGVVDILDWNLAGRDAAWLGNQHVCRVYF